MPSPSDEALAKANINLYAADNAWLWRKHGHGWTEVVRKLVRDHVREQEKQKERL